MNNEAEEIPNTTTAQLPSIVEYFSIEGLYGYRSVSLESKSAATILIAKNGSGKTTLLSSLDAFLKAQFTRLAGLDFRTISCRFSNYPETLTIFKSDIDRMIELGSTGDIAKAAKQWEIDPFALLEFIDEGNVDALGYPDTQDTPIFQTIYTKMGYDQQAAKQYCAKLSKTLHEQNPNLELLRNKIKERLHGIEIVYLPTYRRIELSIPESDSRAGRRRSIQSRLGISRRGLHAADIQFGLSDISERLATLYGEMLFQSTQGYGQISANIINDLITGAFERDSPSPEERPTKEALNLFFSRMRTAERRYRQVPYNYIQTPDLDKIYSGDVPGESTKFLTYFLVKLNSVMRKTKTVEDVVETFITACNRYLSSSDEDIFPHAEDYIEENTTDDKELTFDRKNLQVAVTSKSLGCEIPLDSLSSGEKQMISLFARLYLYPTDKIILIDEPELSLSLDWQRKIIPDILAATSCKQVIAITHSPFIFDNELEPYATALKLRLTQGDLPLFNENKSQIGLRTEDD